MLLLPWWRCRGEHGYGYRNPQFERPAVDQLYQLAGGASNLSSRLPQLLRFSLFATRTRRSRRPELWQLQGLQLEGIGSEANARMSAVVVLRTRVDAGSISGRG